MHESFDAIPEWQAESDNNKADRHGLREGDVVTNAWGSSRVAEISDVGVRFDNGDHVSHSTVAANLRYDGTEITRSDD